MGTYPRIDARISAQERRQTILDARIEELSDDTTTSIKRLSDDMKSSIEQIASYQIETEHKIDTRFNQVDTQLSQVSNRLNTIETRIDKVETLLIQILARLPENP